MDPLITTAARALAAGDPLGALKRVALRDDPPALALRGIAMAQLGDLVRAKALLRRAARAFGPKEAVARARCVVAEAEIALVSRDLRWPAKALDTARATLEAHADRATRRAREVVVLAPPVEEEHARVLAFLADEESWSSSALALALATSQRTVQRALDSLEAAGKVQSFGRGRARRWMTPPMPGFTTTLLLPAPLPSD